MSYTRNTTTEGLDIACSACPEVMRFGAHATIEGIEEAEREHSKMHEQAPVLRVLDERFIAIDNATIYLRFPKGDREIELTVPGLNALAGRAGAWVWRFDGAPGNVAWVRERLNARAAGPDAMATIEAFFPG